MIQSIAAALGILFAVVAIVAISWARFRTKSDETTAALWRAEAEAQKARADRLEATVNDLCARVERLEIENQKLAELATGKADLAEIREIVVEIRALVAAHTTH